MLGVALCIPLILATNKLDGTAHRRADRSIGLCDLLLPLATLITVVGTYSFLAVPPMASVMTGKTFLMNVLALPKSFFDEAPTYLIGAITGGATYALAFRWMVRTNPT